MRLAIRSVVVALLVTISVADLSGGSPATLHGLRYAIRGTESSLRMLLSGAPAYAVEPGRDGITILLTGTRVGSPPGAARLAFASGGSGRCPCTG